MASETCPLAINLIVPVASMVYFILLVIDLLFYFCTFHFATLINLGDLPLCLWHVNKGKIFQSYYFLLLTDCLVYFVSNTNCELKKLSY